MDGQEAEGASEARIKTFWSSVLTYGSCSTYPLKAVGMSRDESICPTPKSCSADELLAKKPERRRKIEIVLRQIDPTSLHDLITVILGPSSERAEQWQTMRE